MYRIHKPTRRLGIGLCVALTCISLIAPGCRQQSELPQEGDIPRVVGSGQAATPVLLLALDGVEWELVVPWLRGGLLPNLEGLIGRGEFGYLETFEPTASPVIWTSVATGKRPAEHGINAFNYRAKDGVSRLYSNSERKTKAVWNIFSDYGKTVSTIGWWMTFPVEPLNGVMVAQTNTSAQVETDFGQHIWKGALVKGIPGQVHPPERQNEMLAVLEQVENELPLLTEEIFGRFPNRLSPLEDRLWANCQWAYRADATYVQIAAKLAENDPPFDLTLVYIGGTDVVGHRFWRYMAPELYEHQPPAEQVENLKLIIRHYYEYVDVAIGELIYAWGPNATIIVVSDHGMVPVNLKARFDSDALPADVNSAHHYEAPPGIFIAAGPCIRKSPVGKPAYELTNADLRTIGSVYDIAPTLLAMQRIPVGEDMTGNILTEIFTDSFEIVRQPARIKTHDTRRFLATRPQRPADSTADEQRTRQLKALGYIAEDEDKP